MSAKRITGPEDLGPIPSSEQRKKARELMAPYLAEFQKAADEQTTQDFSGRQELTVPASAPPWVREIAHRILAEYEHKSPYWLGDSEKHIAEIIAERVRPLVQMLAELAASVEPMVALLQESRREHVMSPCGLRYTYDDSDITKHVNARCTCGADEFNKRLDEVLYGRE